MCFACAVVSASDGSSGRRAGTRVSLLQSGVNIDLAIRYLVESTVVRFNIKQ